MLFVYGSLKRGQENHRELQGARFIRVTRTAPIFALRELAGYPALVPGQQAITGELYRLPMQRLRALDEFEGEGYTRQEIVLASGEKAVAYLACEVEVGTPFAAAEWPGPRPP